MRISRALRLPRGQFVGRCPRVAPGVAHRALLRNLPRDLLSVRGRLPVFRALRSHLSESPDARLPADAPHLSAPSDWSQGLFWTHPMRMVDPRSATSRRPPRRIYIHLFSARPSVHHRFRERALLHAGQRRPGPRPLLAHRVWRARQHVRRADRRADQLLARDHGRRAVRLRRRDSPTT